MMYSNKFKKLFALSAMLLLCGLISACGGGGGGGSSDTVQSDSGTSSSDSGTSGGSTSTSSQPTAAATVTANLSWDAPGTRENGEKLYLYELGGYEIRYRVSGEQEFQTVTINDGDALAYQLEGLEPGVYEFMIAAFDTDGIYSDFSSTQAVDLK